jgi:hypothetical protein
MSLKELEEEFELKYTSKKTLFPTKTEESKKINRLFRSYVDLLVVCQSIDNE